jgi:hypothetical protein
MPTFDWKNDVGCSLPPQAVLKSTHPTPSRSDHVWMGVAGKVAAHVTVCVESLSRAHLALQFSPRLVKKYCAAGGDGGGGGGDGGDGDNGGTGGGPGGGGMRYS